jgi:hypothetical protein
MRKFHSYGPVDCKYHFCVDRKKLVESCVEQLIGIPEEGGHFFTIWAPRQTGKTWLVRQSKKQIEQVYKDQYLVKDISMQAFTLNEQDDPVDTFFRYWKKLIQLELNLDMGQVNTWEDWMTLFEKNSNAFEKPLILLIDEFDKLPDIVIDKVVSMFRHIYLSRNSHHLHALALIGVRSVLGVDSKKGSPFNIQKSIHIPNLTYDETRSMFNDYQHESHQQVDIQVVDQLFEMTNGQPGLIGWFGELLTEKYNDFSEQPITIDAWNNVYAASLHIEHNNTIQNMIIKAKSEYNAEVVKLFTDANIEFSFNLDWCNFMYMHGLITYEKIHQTGEIQYICRFSSPYVQSILYRVFTGESMKNLSGKVMALEPFDVLADVFDEPVLNIPALLDRYKVYLHRLKEKGENPWVDQPRRKSDCHFTEAVGHFHLYHWLKMALDGLCAVVPEFPTGNGKVDLHLICQNKKGLIEVKSYVNAVKYNAAIRQAAEYAAQTRHEHVSIAMFTPFTDEKVLSQLSVTKFMNNVHVHVVAIGQG